ncbi:uncharacterized protein LOC135286749 isoform X2 [Passer domesticus]|uniref:uncharacterized protein LOC135286749 isoform X2 n=1 Tax=Passer domesticus TaxID=48849 RepID=UPI0030FF2F3A
MDMEQGRELNTSPVLILKPKEPSLGDHGTVTLVVALTLSADGVSSLHSSRTNSYPPQHLLGHEGKISAGDLRAKVKKKLHKAESIKAAKITVPHQPQFARLKHVVEKISSSWGQNQMEPRLNWQALNSWDLTSGLNHILDKSVDRHLRGEVEDLALRQNYVNSHKQPKKEDSQYWVGHNQLFYQVLSPVKSEGEPTATITKDEQRLNSNLDFLSDPLVQGQHAVSSRGGATAEKEHSSLGGHLLLMPDTTDTHWKQQEEGSRFLNKPWSPQSPDLAPVPGELLEAVVDRQLRLLVPDKSLQMFMAHVERALRRDCSLPQLQQACAKMVSKTGLLLKVLSERQETHGAYDPMGRCPLQENISRRTALEEDQEPTEKMRFLSHEGASQASHTRKLWLRRFCVKLVQRGRKDNKEAQNVEQQRAESSSHRQPLSLHARASLLLKGLPSIGALQRFSLFRKSEVPLVQCITDSYESDKKGFQEET